MNLNAYLAFELINALKKIFLLIDKSISSTYYSHLIMFFNLKEILEYSLV